MLGRNKDKDVKPAKVPDAPPGVIGDGAHPVVIPPQRAKFFDAMRSDAFMNQNLVYNYMEFWAAIQVDQRQDKWRIMHYMIFDVEQPDGKFRAENLTKDGDVDFQTALRKLATYNENGHDLDSLALMDMSPEKYPVDQYPELKVHFFDVEHYKTVGNIEGFVFDSKSGMPLPRLEGKVFLDATLQRSEVGRSILAVEQARANPKVAAKIEGGILSDIFNSASARDTSLDSVLKVGKILACLDSFVAAVGGFYLGVQSVLGRTEALEKLQCLTPEEKKDLQGKAAAWGKNVSFPVLTEKLLPEMRAGLDEAEALGVHVEPFRKFAAECELYVNLLQASQSLKKLKQDMSSVGGANADLIIAIQKSVDAAQQKFMGLGGSVEQVDRLKAWVVNPAKEPIPGWLPGFIDRYYDQRRKVMQKVQQRQAGPREVGTMTAKVKPPIVE